MHIILKYDLHYQSQIFGNITNIFNYILLLREQIIVEIMQITKYSTRISKFWRYQGKRK